MRLHLLKQDETRGPEAYARPVGAVVSAWGRRRLSPFVVDGAIALAFFGYGIAEYVEFVRGTLFAGSINQRPTGGVPALLILFASTVPLAFRRRAPVAVFFVVAGCYCLLPETNVWGSGATGFAVAIALYSLAAAYPGRWPSLVGWAAVVFGDWLNLRHLHVPLFQAIAVWGYNEEANALVWFGGYVEGRRRELAADLAARAREIEDGRRDGERLAVARERGRIAGDLQRIVADSLDALVGWARLARERLSSSPAAAATAIAAVESTGRQALVDMRRLLGVLRTATPSSSGLSVQPGLRDLANLVARSTDPSFAAGLSVRGEIEGVPDPLGRTIYRIVEEALEDSKGNGHASRASVTLVISAEVVAVLVEDDRGVAEDHGLSLEQAVRLRERASIFHGRMKLASPPGGGFVLRIRFPVEADHPRHAIMPPEEAAVDVEAGSRPGRSMGGPPLGGRAFRSLRARVAKPVVVDVALASWLSVGASIEFASRTLALFGTGYGLLAYLFVVGQPLALLWRRRSPFAALLVISALTVLQGALNTTSTTSDNWAILVAVYSVAAQHGGWRLGSAVLLGSFADYPGLVRAGTPVLFLITFFPPAIAAAVFGHSANELRRLGRERGAQNVILERQQRERTRLIVQEERARVAREMHDVVAHGVSVMVVQAGAAGRVVAGRADLAAEALDDIERTGSRAREEMAVLLQVLNSDDRDDADRESAGLDGLRSLVQHARSAGSNVTLHLGEHEAAAERGLEMSAYRIVQEALTNARKHARGAAVVIRVEPRRDGVEIEVVNDPGERVPSSEELPGAGHGIIGMQERVAMFGGELQAGTTSSGGYRVWAWLPASSELTFTSAESTQS
jgi:signal transduction histidine kinase